jgi:hypothetical protein
MGRRFDSSPVLLTVNVKKVFDAKVKIFAFGKCLYLASKIPNKCFTGPSVPKEKSYKKEATQPATQPKKGSFFLNLNGEDSQLCPKKRIKSKKDKGWKEAHRKSRRGLKNDWS